MSIRVMTQVWQHSTQKQTALLVMLALADFANDDGWCWPSIDTLAEKARTSRRNVQGIIRNLDGVEIEINAGKGRKGTHLYRVIVGSDGDAETAPPAVQTDDRPDMGDAKSDKGDAKSDMKGVNSSSSEPSVKPSIKPSNKNTLRKIAEDTFTAETGISPPKKKSEAGTRWWVPLRQICEIAEWDERRIPLLIRAGIKYQDQKELSYDAPQSILKAVRYLISQEHRKKIDIENYVGGTPDTPQIGKFLDDIA